MSSQSQSSLEQNTQEDNLDDFLDLLENGFDDGEEIDTTNNSKREEQPSTSPSRKALQDLTYEDIFGSPEKSEAKNNNDNSSRTKVESCSNSFMAQLGSQPVQPAVLKNVSQTMNGFDTSQLLIDHFSRIRLFKTSIALYRDEGTNEEAVLRERNFGLQYVSLLNFPFWFRTKGTEIKNFWTSGVLARKQPGVRKSAKGNEYAVWEVNDLKQLDKSWTIFLFSSSASAPSLSVIPIGSLIDITTPSVLPDSNKGGSSSIKFSINNSNQIRLVGTAKDFGFCQSKKKDGKNCTAVVNTWECCTCIYHASSELKKMNSSGSTGRKRDRKPAAFPHGNLFDGPPMKNPKSEGICTVNFGGRPTTATGKSSKSSSNNKLPVNMPIMGSTRMALQGSSVCSEVKRNSLSVGNASSISFKKENNQHLSKLPSVNTAVDKLVLNLDPSKTRHLTEKDRMILSALGSPTKKSDKIIGKNSDDESTSESTKTGKDNNKKLITKQQKSQCSAEIASKIVSNPTAGSLNFMKYLTGNEQREAAMKEDKYNVHDTRIKEIEPISMTRETMKNMKKALDLVKLKGPIQKKDPNEVAKRRSLPSSSSSRLSSKQSNIEVEFDFESDNFKRILNAKSAHDEHTTELVQGEYFDKLVKKEAIENKLLSTFSIATNAVMCKQCKYVALGQSEFCKEKQHQIRVVKATKRFFKCKDCGNRTMSLDRLPKQPCKQCNSSSWLAAPVGKEKTGPILPTEVLSIRGHEEKFIGTSGSKMFLNLEVS